MIDFRSTPEPLTLRQRVAVTSAAAIVLVTRIWGLARSPWDWDEILFSLAMRDYNVALHHPHPPGFPLFIGFAKLLQLMGLDDFRALQAQNIIAAALLVPAIFFFCRELRFQFSTSMSAALVFAFLPNVWFFGETAFSDVPAVVLVVLACAFLLRGCRSTTSLFIGAILLAISAGFRPQNLVVGFLPAAIAAWYQVRQRRASAVIGAVVVGAVIVIGSYWIASSLTGGWPIYRDALRNHQEYIARVDSFRSAIRPPLSRVSDDFFVRPYRAPLINYSICLFALVSFVTALVMRRWPVLIAIATFVPFAISAWLVLDFLSASRFSIGYAPLVAIMAADGIAVIARKIWIEYLLAALLVSAMIFWTAPAVAIPARSISPPVQAAEWIRRNVGPGAVLRVHRRMRPYAEYFLPQHKPEWTTDPSIDAFADARAFYLKEGSSPVPGTQTFSWPRGNLWNVARRRYFDVSVVPLTGISFGEGFYDEEKESGDSWRWMGTRGVISLPPTNTAVRLRLRLFIPHAATVLVSFNGRLIDTIAAQRQEVEREYVVAPRADTPNLLTLETDRVVNPRAAGLGTDTRDLGVRLDDLEWILADAP